MSGAEPRYATPRTRRLTTGLQVQRMASLLGGRQLMPWQVGAVNVAGELVEMAIADLPRALQRKAAKRARGGVILVPAFREFAFTVPRQSGKTTILQARAQQRAMGDPWGGAQRMLYSAQTGTDAAAKLKEDWHPEFLANRAVLNVTALPRGNGSEGINWGNGSLLRLMSDRESAGHGKTLHYGMQDELFKDVDDRRDAAMIPAMSTVFDAQLDKTSTAGTTASTAWNTVVDRGRMAAERGDTWGTCYIEYSAPIGSDPDDPQVWASCMPGLGQTIRIEDVRHARGTMSLAEFCRAYLNIPVGAAEDYVFSQGVWERSHGPVARPERLSPMGTLALAVAQERDYAWLVWAHPRGDRDVDCDVLVEGSGLHWVVDALEVAWSQHGVPIRFAASSPAASLKAEAEVRGIAMLPIPSTDVAAACGALFDVVTASPPRIAHPPRPRLDDAATHLEKRRTAGAFTWDPTGDVDPAPVTAVSLAVHGVLGTPDPPTPFTADAPGVY